MADIVVELTLLPFEQGGRRAPVGKSYRPLFHYGTAAWDALYEYDVPAVVPQGRPVAARLTFDRPQEHWGKLSVGLPFQLREGNRIVGYGRITELLDLEISARKAKSNAEHSASISPPREGSTSITQQPARAHRQLNVPLGRHRVPGIAFQNKRDEWFALMRQKVKKLRAWLDASCGLNHISSFMQRSAAKLINWFDAACDHVPKFLRRLDHKVGIDRIWAKLNTKEPNGNHRVDKNGKVYCVIGGRWTKDPPLRDLAVAGHRYKIIGQALNRSCLDFGNTRIVTPTGDLLLIAASIFTLIGRGILIAFFAGCLLYIFANVLSNGASNQENARGLILPGILCTALISSQIMLLSCRCRFDRSTGRAIMCKFFKQLWEVALDDMVAVQCLHAGWFRGKGGWQDSYEVNLVLRTGDDHRLPVWNGNHKDERKFVRLRAQELADFLQVPLVDQIYDTWVPCPRPRWWQ